MFNPTSRLFKMTQLFSGYIDNGGSTTITVPQDAQFLVFRTAEGAHKSFSVAISDILASHAIGIKYNTGILVHKDPTDHSKSRYYDRYTRIEVMPTGTALKWRIFVQGPYADDGADRIDRIYAVSYAS